MMNLNADTIQNIDRTVAELHNAAQQTGSVRTALVQRLNSLPTQAIGERKPEEIAGTFLTIAAEFLHKVDTGYTADELRAMIDSQIAKMSGEQAIAYLTTLEYTYRLVNVAAVRDHLENQPAMPTAAEIQTEIANIVANPGDKTLEQRVDELVEKLTGDELNATVMAAGNETLIQALEEGTFGTHLAAMVNDTYGKSEQYAMRACAFYEEAVQGRLDGVAPDTDPAMMTALLSAGFAKGEVLAQVAQGEIDETKAEKILGIIEAALAWTLAIVVAVAAIAAGLYVIALAASVLLEMGVAVATVRILVLLGSLVGLGHVLDHMDEIRTVTEKLVLWTDKAIRIVADALGRGVKTLQQLGEKVRTVPTKA